LIRFHVIRHPCRHGIKSNAGPEMKKAPRYGPDSVDNASRMCIIRSLMCRFFPSARCGESRRFLPEAPIAEQQFGAPAAAAAAGVQQRPGRVQRHPHFVVSQRELTVVHRRRSHQHRSRRPGRSPSRTHHVPCGHPRHSRSRQIGPCRPVYDVRMYQRIRASQER